MEKTEKYRGKRIKEGRVKSTGAKVVDFVIAVFISILVILCLVPMINLLARSLSSGIAIAQRQVGLLPVDLTFESYMFVVNDASYVWSLIFTAIITVIAVVVSMTLTVCMAFPLTYPGLRGKKLFNIMMIMTIYFSAGMIPFFLLMRDLSLLDNPLVLIIPNSISVFNVIILKSFFMSTIPDSLRESAEIEGANPMQVLFRIYLPLSLPVLATLTLFYAVGRWNGFTDALVFIVGNRDFQPIQLRLFQLIQGTSSIETATLDPAAVAGVTESVRAATVMFATVPILLIYPWLQRFFISGVTLGAIKE